MVYTILQRDIVFLQGRILIGGPREPPQEMKREREKSKSKPVLGYRDKIQKKKGEREKKKEKSQRIKDLRWGKRK